MRKYFRIAVAALTASTLALAGCSGSGSDDGTVAIDFYYPINVGGPLESTMNEFISEFEEQHPDISVTPVYSGDYNQTVAAVRSAASAGDSPAAAVLMSTEMYSMLDENLITPISEIVEDQEWFDDFHDAFMVNSMDGDTVVSLPFQRSTVVQFWNKEHFEQAGLDPETPPTTWDELVEMGTAVQENSDTTWAVQIPSDTPNGAWILQAFTIQNGQQLASEDGTEVYLDHPATIEGLQNWGRLSEAGLAQDGTIAWGTLPNEFAQGNASIIWTTTGQLTNIRDQANFDFGVSMLPANHQLGSPTGGGNFYILADAPEDEQAAAAELGRFLTSPEIMARWTIASGYVAPTESAWETDALAEYVEEFPAATVARDQLPHAVGELGTYRRGEIEDLINAMIASVMNGQDPAEAAAEAQEDADEILAPYQNN